MEQDLPVEQGLRDQREAQVQQDLRVRREQQQASAHRQPQRVQSVLPQVGRTLLRYLLSLFHRVLQDLQVLPEAQARQDQRDQRGPMVMTVQMEAQDQPVQRDLPEAQDLQDLPERRRALEHQLLQPDLLLYLQVVQPQQRYLLSLFPLALQALPDLQVPQAQPDLPVLPVQQVEQDQQEQQQVLERLLPRPALLLYRQVVLILQRYSPLLFQPEQQVLQGHPEAMVQMVAPVQRVPQAQQDQRGEQDLQVQQDLQDRMEHLVGLLSTMIPHLTLPILHPALATLDSTISQPKHRLRLYT